MCEWDGEHHRAHRHCANWGGLVIQAPVNKRESINNRISSGKVISCWLIVTSANFCLKLTFGAGNLLPSVHMGPLDLSIYTLFVRTYNL